MERNWNKNLCEYHDLYVRSNTLLLADVFENFQNKYIEMLELDPAYFIFAAGLLRQEDIDMLLIVEKSIRSGICHSICWYTEANNKYIWKVLI